MFKRLKISAKVGAVFVASLIIYFVVFGYIFYMVADISREVGDAVPQSINNISQNSESNSLAEQIKYYDEVLTQSARNYAFTGDKYWQKRYNDNLLPLDSAIKKAITSGDQEDKNIFASVDSANSKLVEMETASLELVDEGNLSVAQNILDSSEYASQKEIYRSGLEKYYQRKDSGLNQVLSVSTDKITEIINDVSADTKVIWIAIFVLVILQIVFDLVLFVLLRNLILKRIEYVRNFANKIAEGDLEQKIDIQTNDEIGQLSSSFNKMAVDLLESRQNIEQKVEDRTKDLERLNKSMVGRELKMVELKKHINQLESNKETRVNQKLGWSGKFLQAVDLEDKVVVELEKTYLEAIKKSDWSPSKKHRGLELISKLIADSKRHKKKFIKLAEEENVE